jgi:hypothetical protein
MRIIFNAEFSKTPLASYFNKFDEMRVSSTCIPDLIIPSVGISFTIMGLQNNSSVASKLKKISQLHIKV